MHYVIARMHQHSEELAYRIYISDAMMILTENTAKYAGGRHFKQRYYEQIRPEKKKAVEDNRSGQEISKDIITRLTKGGKE